VFVTAVWFQAMTHTEVCHGDGDSDHQGHSAAASSACTCVCHTPMVSLESDLPKAVTCDVEGVPPSEEPVNSRLLPSDIFRPPVTLS
jgi:hypothetical protein